jgi:hypothetical protein
MLPLKPQLKNKGSRLGTPALFKIATNFQTINISIMKRTPDEIKRSFDPGDDDDDGED